ncbi:F0F1 ATP synthase subunit epsilon [Mesobaculum littorinae]|uniref:ATP synthase epsilon chain n=1 Tax=Mesobaculum littorinae TaxID=2486419 RepID=A0A438AE74_9RHOB|nr:F0F1 ATP synthase subunit epsilon [Mesobaculum littorinae]RVV96962.1 F0F1 ATP synthase subunit epsilon [Mesobaculum littorinae]
MADTMQFDLVSPERRLVSRQVTEVRIPGADGDLTAGPGHVPVITTLRPGILRIDGPDGGVDEYAVTGGFAEINGESVSVLAEQSLHTSDVTQEVLEGYMVEAEKAHARARDAGEHSAADDIAKVLSDMVAMGTHVGLNPRQPNL